MQPPYDLALDKSSSNNMSQKEYYYEVELFHFAGLVNIVVLLNSF